MMTKETAAQMVKNLGGRQFMAMTGVKQFVMNEKDYSISAKLMRNQTGANYFKLKLNAMDTYDLSFIKCSMKTGDMTTVKEVSGIYNDQLRAIFTECTGLYTHL